MNKHNLTLAVCDYDHVRDFVSGAVAAEGLNINFFDELAWMKGIVHSH